MTRMFEPDSYDEIESYLETEFPKLLTEFCLSVNGIAYHFAEIELYWFDAVRHYDRSVLKRGTTSGEIFFHQYGFDLSFKTAPGKYGGILIRSLACGTRVINGPMRCKSEILNNRMTDAETYSLTMRIRKMDHPRNVHILRARREVSERKTGAFRGRLYRYLSDFNLFDERYVKEKFTDQRIVPEEYYPRKTVISGRN